MFFYSDTEVKGPGGAVRANPVRAYLRHYDNSLFLKFVAQRDPSPKERGQALRELTICERKLEYWKKRPGFVQAEALKGIQDIKKKWK